ncbi:MAG: hypothetical protein BWY15_01985 [Firmicutes bacterium ADurb.Bin193]|nr:MAG: hypothetical protein BWY15_01985 [Firmicutes bacterium ADurb.Bin193]
MMVDKPAKLKTDDLISTSTMFFVDKEVDERFSQKVSDDVNSLKDKLQRINSPDELKKYIREDKKSISNIITLLSIRVEKFKRVVTMLRLAKGHNPTGEWDTKKIRSVMLEDSCFMDEICELLTSGATSEKFIAKMPLFYLENFTIDLSKISLLTHEDAIKRFVKQGLEVKYNSSIKDSFFERATGIIKSICEGKGLLFKIKQHISLIDREASFVIYNNDTPAIIIDIAYGVTTSSAQTRYATQAEKTAKTIKNKNKHDGTSIAYVNLLDGAGWVGRLSDYKKIHRCSDYLLNLNSLNTIEQIIDYYIG